jgi:chromosome segregation protein
LLREVRRNLRPLERQADAARRHGSLVDELRAVQTYLLGRELQGFQSRLTNLAGDRLAGEEAERELRAALSALDTTVMAAEAQLSARGDSGVNDELVRIEQLRGRAKGLLGVLAERRRSIERDRGQLMDSGVVATLEADASSLRAELTKVNEQIAAIAGMSDSGDLTSNSLASLDEARAATERVGQLTADVRGLNEEIDRLRIAVATDTRNEAELNDRLASADTARQNAEASLDGAMALFATAQSDATTATARAEALQLALDANATSASALRDIDGAIGSLVDLIEIDAERRVAVQVALGDRPAPPAGRARAGGGGGGGGPPPPRGARAQRDYHGSAHSGYQ